MNQQDFIKKHLQDSIQTKQLLLENEECMTAISNMANSLIKCFQAKGKLLLCGNGGSTCDAMHIAEELTGRYLMDRPPLPAIAISDPSHLTCVSNDYGFEKVFSRAVEAYGKEGDCLLAISTSGNSENVIQAIHAAKNLKLNVLGFSGKNGGKMKDLCDSILCVPSTTTSRIQESHITVGHLLIEMIENELFGASS